MRQRNRDSIQRLSLLQIFRKSERCLKEKLESSGGTTSDRVLWGDQKPHCLRGFGFGIIAIAAAYFLWPFTRDNFENYLKAREARKTPEQRRKEQAAAKSRLKGKGRV
jgi:hypothetical protein